MPEQQAHKQDADDRSRLDIGNPDVGDQIPEADDRKDQQDRVFAEQHKDINCHVRPPSEEWKLAVETIIGQVRGVQVQAQCIQATRLLLQAQVDLARAKAELGAPGEYNARLPAARAALETAKLYWSLPRTGVRPMGTPPSKTGVSAASPWPISRGSP